MFLIFILFKFKYLDKTYKYRYEFYINHVCLYKIHLKLTKSIILFIYTIEFNWSKFFDIVWIKFWILLFNTSVKIWLFLVKVYKDVMISTSNRQSKLVIDLVWNNKSSKFPSVVTDIQHIGICFARIVELNELCRNRKNQRNQSNAKNEINHAVLKVKGLNTH